MLEEGRGSLPFALVHGEALVVCAAWALGEAGVTLLDTGTTWESIREADETLVLHDSLCPLTPAAFIAACVERARVEDAVVVATRPVTDTVKVLAQGVVGPTVDRDGLTAIVSPVVLPPSVVATLPEAPDTDLVSLVADLARSHRIVLVEAPASARRVTSTEDLPMLEALTEG
ncbi:2-C-methyl-D-erythritol 4-phosphate cytidylyltransferase [Nocardioides piscis]|uniref:2-C-methyl-D-erythritol 4-phosphate cytidylyltransferase n=1 Tax=Nocardioides piscis TaxID=2714938 RepID=A0A6G7YF41_9ACTN|nr:2-C-methyl-D-erythritol 4-phosphate cytidylyltransferase [Nocardioides piscis]QIK75296.1 hypothetical protein G7071_07475 [Nocardioides piscis]